MVNRNVNDETSITAISHKVETIDCDPLKSVKMFFDLKQSLQVACCRALPTVAVFSVDGASLQSTLTINYKLITTLYFQKVYNL